VRKTYIIITIFTTLLSLVIGWLVGSKTDLLRFQSGSIVSPFVAKEQEKPKPLLKYTIANLKQYPFETSRVVIEDIIEEEPDYTSYVFSYRTAGKKMTGQLNIPTATPPITGYPVILMMRGWAPAETYATGVGTKPAAAVLARNGYVTLAPDFYGYGGSDPDVEDTWESRFLKPVNVIELLKTIEAQKNITVDNQPIPLNTTAIGFWAHSNGGQITLTTLEILSRPIPTVLWAPVSAPFPYSLLFFTDEDQDEGKGFRKVLANFETDYNVHDFNFTQHIDFLTGKIQIHQGTADDAVPLAWSQEFSQKVDKENDRRTEIEEQIEDATAGAALDVEPPLPQIELTLLVYPGMDHNMRPNWDTVMQRDLQFFAVNLR
jgi:hypothetical protein